MNFCIPKNAAAYIFAALITIPVGFLVRSEYYYILFSMIIDRLGIFINTLEQITSYIDLDAGYLSTMFKMTSGCSFSPVRKAAGEQKP